MFFASKLLESWTQSKIVFTRGAFSKAMRTVSRKGAPPMLRIFSSTKFSQFGWWIVNFIINQSIIHSMFFKIAQSKSRIGICTVQSIFREPVFYYDFLSEQCKKWHDHKLFIVKNRLRNTMIQRWFTLLLWSGKATEILVCRLFTSSLYLVS